MVSSPASRPWWRSPGPLLLLLLHAGLFLGAYQLRFDRTAWQRLEQQLPAQPTVAQWYHALVDTHGFAGLAVWFFDTHGEVRLYHRYASVAVHGVDPKLPADAPGQGTFRIYREVRPEYQPGAILVMAVPALIARSENDYTTAYTAWAGGLYLATALLGMGVLAGSERISPALATRTLIWSLLFVLAFGSIAASRFDVVVPLTIVTALALLQRGLRGGAAGWLVASGAVVALGVMTKIVPGLLLAAALLWLVTVGGRQHWRAAVLLAFGCGATLVILHLGFQAWFGDGYLASYTYHVQRALQIESTYAGVLMALPAAGEPLAHALRFGAIELQHPAAAACARLAPFIFLAAAALLALAYAWRNRRRDATDRDLSILLLTIVLLLVFMLTNKVFSPQYLLWVTPLAAVAAGARPRLGFVAAALLIPTICTQVLFPYLYDFLTSFHPAMVALLNARNLLLLVIAGWWFWHLPPAREGKPSHAER
ncbi:glycosyltransferase 87 family protein [Opitutus sp. ER46]|uniref:glycosyltransferase 87 family protein n=1 Tax=Opitutus sp. ER46 TaxID=2161864 RepID=UPI000D31EEEF|nr:glycosyltransferase 87 family protein [Opitutus sp. ER46]PTX91681.1 hypothetical protein DB354_17595 [Opitutus sp. ER46]